MLVRLGRMKLLIAPQLARVVGDTDSVTIHALIADHGGGYAEKSIGSQPGDRKLMHSASSKCAAHPQRLFYAVVDQFWHF